MIKGLLKIGLILVVGILVYNRFFGTDVEKQQAKEVFGSVKGVVHSVAGILKSEKAKFDEGKYDKVMDKLGDAYKTVREKAQFVDQKVLSQLDDLEKRKAELQKELDDLKADSGESSTAEKGLKGERPTDETKTASEASRKERERRLKKELEKLADDTEKLLEDAQQEQEQ